MARNEDEAEHSSSNPLPCPGLQMYHNEFGGVQGETAHFFPIDVRI